MLNKLTLGAKVDHNVGIAGNQIDVVVIEKDDSGNPFKVAIECKAYSKPVGLSVVNSFAAVSYLLTQRGLVEKTRMISLKGYTKEARQAAKAHKVELLELEDIRSFVQGKEKKVEKKAREIDEEYKKALSNKMQPPRLFAVMPFEDDFIDVFILGIQHVAEELGMIVVRADLIEHNEEIMQTIHKEIRNSSIVVADTTKQNPNVFYEIGFSHGTETPTILITKEIDAIPFDLSGINHISYKNIVDLQGKLHKRLKSTLEKVKSK